MKLLKRKMTEYILFDTQDKRQLALQTENTDRIDIVRDKFQSQ